MNPLPRVGRRLEDDTVKVILCENVINLGEMGETVSVAEGYARNFLLPRKLAVRADSASAKQIEHEMRIIRKREDSHREFLRGVAGELTSKSLTFERKAGEQDKLFGSVTSANIAEALKEIGIEIDRRGVQLPDPIKELGTFEVKVKLGNGVEGQIKVIVAKEDAELITEAEAEEEDVDENEFETESMAQIEAKRQAKAVAAERKAAREAERAARQAEAAAAAAAEAEAEGSAEDGEPAEAPAEAPAADAAPAVEEAADTPSDER
jgi:large subunit ribosomal protein L9